MIEDTKIVTPEVADIREASAEPKAPEPISPQVSASTAHVHGLIEHLKSEWLALEEKFNKALADLRSHL